MELACQLEKYQALLEPEWAPRDVNQEADDLTNSRAEGFRSELKLASTMDEVGLMVLPQLHRRVLEFYASVVAWRW